MGRLSICRADEGNKKQVGESGRSGPGNCRKRRDSLRTSGGQFEDGRSGELHGPMTSRL